MGEYIEYEEKTNPESIATTRTIECTICAKLYPNKDAVNTHYKRTHEKFITGGKNTKSLKNVLSRVKSVKCHECGETKNSNQSLKYHLNKAHHAWRDLNLKVLTNERDLYQACLFTQWSAKMLVPEIIEGEIWHNCKYLR